MINYVRFARVPSPLYPPNTGGTHSDSAKCIRKAKWKLVRGAERAGSHIW